MHWGSTYPRIVLDYVATLRWESLHHPFTLVCCWGGEAAVAGARWTVWTGAQPHHESTASRGPERRLALQEEKLWRERGRQQLESFRLAPWASRRRRDLLELLDRLNPTIAELSQAIRFGGNNCQRTSIPHCAGLRSEEGPWRIKRQSKAE
jgi:hypothetical protein